MKARIKTTAVTPAQAGEAIGLLQDIALAGHIASFEEKLAIIRLLDVRVLYDGETIELSGCIPTQSITLNELRQLALNHPDTSSPLP